MPRAPRRKLDAAELVKRLEEGPCFDNIPKEHKDLFMLWLGSWVTPQVKRLIPELKNKQEGGKA